MSLITTGCVVLLPDSHACDAAAASTDTVEMDASATASACHLKESVLHRSSAALMILTGRRVYYTVIKNLPSCAFPPDSDWRAGPGHPRRVVPLAGSRGPHHHGDGSAPILPQLLPENPACSVGAGRPSASPLEAVHRSDGQKRHSFSCFCLEQCESEDVGYLYPLLIIFHKSQTDPAISTVILMRSLFWLEQSGNHSRFQTGAAH